jgi:hypothetical protein
MVMQVTSLPASVNFDREVQQLLNSELWRAKAAVEDELRTAWESFFKAAVKSAVSGAIAVVLHRSYP